MEKNRRQYNGTVVSEYEAATALKLEARRRGKRVAKQKKERERL